MTAFQWTKRQEINVKKERDKKSTRNRERSDVKKRKSLYKEIESCIDRKR